MKKRSLSSISSSESNIINRVTAKKRNKAKKFQYKKGRKTESEKFPTLTISRLFILRIIQAIKIATYWVNSVDGSSDIVLLIIIAKILLTTVRDISRYRAIK